MPIDSIFMNIPSIFMHHPPVPHATFAHFLHRMHYLRQHRERSFAWKALGDSTAHIRLGFIEPVPESTGIGTA